MEQHLCAAGATTHPPTPNSGFLIYEVPMYFIGTQLIGGDRLLLPCALVAKRLKMILL